MVKKGVKTLEYLMGFAMNVLSVSAVLSLFIATIKFLRISDDHAKRVHCGC